MSGSARAQTSAPGAPPAPLDGILSPYLASHGLPALAAAVIQNGEIVAIGAVGTREAGAQIPVTPDDRFHLGSDTKAMTGLAVAMLVEAGKMRWDTTVGEVLPELVPTMNPKLAGVTVEQLLSHTSGVAADDRELAELLAKAFFEDGDLKDLRLAFVKKWCGRPLSSDPGTQFEYANMNYVLVGVMIERLTGRNWENFVTERIFVPLGLASGGFGPQASVGKVDAPLGHELVDGKPRPIGAGPNADNPLILGPAGTAHMSLRDFARWAGWNAGQGKRDPVLVAPETLRKLQHPVVSMPDRPSASPGTPSHGRYGLGWGEVDVDWAPAPLVYHGGSNQLNLAHIWLDPARDFAMVVVTNVGQQKANDALFAIAPELYRKFAPAPPKP